MRVDARARGEGLQRHLAACAQQVVAREEDVEVGLHPNHGVAAARSGEVDGPERGAVELVAADDFLRPPADIGPGLVERVDGIVLDRDELRPVDLGEREEDPQVARVDVDAHVDDGLGRDELEVQVGNDLRAHLVAIKPYA
eukprot:scaffold75966_cov74-Phaeocystis_antarctica.AAC.8